MGATASAMLAGAPALACYAFGAATATLLTVTHPAHAVMSPAIARTTEQLVALNAITGWILSVGLVAAPALAGLILAIASPGAVYAAGALCLVAAAVLVLPLRGLLLPVAQSADRASRPSAAGELKEAVGAIARGGPATEVMLVLGATFVTVGAFDVLAVVLAVGVLDLGGSGAAYLTALYGAGSVLGTAGSFWLVGRARIVPVLLPATFAGGAVFIVLGVATSLAAALIVAVLAGISRGLLEVCATTLLQRVTPTALLARMLAFKEGLTMAAWGLGSVLVPALIALGDVSAALIGTGAIAPIVVLARFRGLLRVDAAATVPVVAIALLRSMRLFRALPAFELEATARAGIDLSVRAGTRLITEGGVRRRLLRDSRRARRGHERRSHLGHPGPRRGIRGDRPATRHAPYGQRHGDDRRVAVRNRGRRVRHRGHRSCRERTAGRLDHRRTARRTEPGAQRRLRRALRNVITQYLHDR